ncbi:hypothetical protein NMY22_g10602 [Coprinellus aureogranulatus]|nr:hypothetical protein NMY22_g10602 [Coprinellus aureogranulatus]
MAASIHADVVGTLQTYQEFALAFTTTVLVFLIEWYLLRPQSGLFWRSRRTRLTASCLEFVRNFSSMVEEIRFVRSWDLDPEDPETYSGQSTPETRHSSPTSSGLTSLFGSPIQPAAVPLRPTPPAEKKRLSQRAKLRGVEPLNLVNPPGKLEKVQYELEMDTPPNEDYIPLPVLTDSPAPPSNPPPPPTPTQPKSAYFPPKASKAETHEILDHLMGLRIRHTPEPSLSYTFGPYTGASTQLFLDTWAPRKPLALDIKVVPSADPRIMQKRYNDLCAFLTSDIAMAKAESIHSLEITFPSSSAFIFESAEHPYDNSPEEYLCLADVYHETRYRNQFPNLVEFGWTGALGRRKGDGTYAALPTPFHDLVSLPYYQLRRLEFKKCLMTLSDCCVILHSSPQLEIFTVDTVIGTSKRWESDGPAYPPALGLTPGQVPLRGYSALGFSRPETGRKAGGENEIGCPSLAKLELRTSIALDHFFWMLDAPKLTQFKYEPAGRDLECVTMDNFPFSCFSPFLRSLVVRACSVEGEVARELVGQCGDQGIELQFLPPSRS